MPVLTVVAGPNGSGKSSLTSALRLSHRVPLVDPDAIARRLNPANVSKAAIPAAKEALTVTEKYIAGRTSFAVETTLAGNGPIALIRRAKADGFQVVLLYVALDNPELQIKRVRQRLAKGGHGVPDADIRRRYERSLANAPEALRLADKALIFDNTGKSLRRVLTARNGEIVWRSAELPTWLKTALKL